MKEPGSITVVGLGPGRSGLITLESMEAMRNAKSLLLRTEVHPSAGDLRRCGIPFTSYDAWYEKAASFEELYHAIAEDLAARARAGEAIVYAVPGSPFVAERTVIFLRELCAKEGMKLAILPGMSFVETLYGSLGIDPVDGLMILDASDAANLPAQFSTGVLFTQVYSREIASDLKLALMERMSDETQVVYLHNIALPDESVRPMPLYEIDRQLDVDHLTSLFLPAFRCRND